MEPNKPSLSSKPGSEKQAGPWRPTKRQVLWAIGMVVALLTTALLIVNLHPEIWKGLLEEQNLTLIAIGVSVTAIIVLLAIGGAASRWTGFRGMTVRDWLDLLVVPLALVVISLLFATQQEQRQQQIENQRAEAERELAVQRAQDEALQAYLDQMSTLLLEKDLRNSEEDSEERTLARARTLTVVGRLDPSRKTAVMQFLEEARLVREVDGREPVIALTGANLSGADLSSADLNGAKLSEANLSEANLSEADLSEADLLAANLSGAVLWRASLAQADLRVANLRGANLRETHLARADLNAANLRGVDLPDADLRDANLIGANLRETHLARADLSGAVLWGADLSEANLSGADLSGAEGMTNEKLERQADSLEGATMPNY